LPPYGYIFPNAAGMNTVLAVAIGGAVGSVARYLAMSAIGKALFSSFPWGTFAVNVLGSFIMGVLVECFALKWSAGLATRALLTTGFLGGFTTFSTFSLDAAVLIERGELAAAAAYVVGSVVAGLIGLFLGLHVVRWILA